MIAIEIAEMVTIRFRISDSGSYSALRVTSSEAGELRDALNEAFPVAS